MVATKNTRNKKVKKLVPKSSIIKGPTSTWINFLTHIRNQKLPENDNLTFGDLCKKLSPVWKKMSDQEKQPYKEAYEKDRARYLHEAKNLTDEQKKIIRAHRRRKKRSRENHPKPALSAYMIFVSKERPKIIHENPKIEFKDVGKQLGIRWKRLTEPQKAVYNKLSGEDKTRYKNEMEEFKKQKKQNRANKKDKVKGQEN